MKGFLVVFITFAAAFMLLFGCPQQPMPGSDRDAHGCIGSAGYSWCDAKQKCIRSWEENCTSKVVTPVVTPVVVGNDSDAHGCKGSAGYSWCESSQKCIRAWEENCTLSLDDAKKIAMENGSDCAKYGTLGNYTDYRSNNESGNFWWLELNVNVTNCGAACVVYESNKSASVAWMCTGAQLSADDQAKSFCGQENVDKVYTCGPYVRVVSKLIGGGSTFYQDGKQVAQCPIVAPDSMSDQCRLLLLGNNCAEKEIC